MLRIELTELNIVSNKPNNLKYTLLVFIIAYTFVLFYFFGFYYEFYESLFTALLSGSLTPEVQYNNLFYFGHVGLSHIYSWFYTIAPKISWLNYFSYLYLITATFLIIKPFFNFSKLGWFIYSLAAFILWISAEHFILLNLTRVSMLLTFGSLFALIFSPELDKKTNYFKSIFLLLISTLGILTRVESGILIIVIIILFLTIYYPPEISNKKKRTLLKLLYPILLIVFCTAWFKIDIKTSDEFYKQIEPNLEYELMVRNNILEISSMKNARDSVRYMAVYDGMWGDAKTNDLYFLKSLIKHEDFKLWDPYTLHIAYVSIVRSINNCLSISITLLILFLFSIGLLIADKKYKSALRLLLFNISFWILLFIISYKAKMVERGLSPMLFSVSILHIYILLKHTSLLKRKVTKAIFVFILFFIAFYHYNFLSSTSDKYSREYNLFNKRLDFLEKNLKDKSLMLNKESVDILMKSQRPFKSFDFSSFKSILIYDMLAFNTIEPYKSYLALKCNCNPLDYKSFFSNIIHSNEIDPLFVISESSKNFLKEYLITVHKQNTSWTRFNYSDNALNFNWEKINFSNQNNLYIYEVSFDN